VNDGRNVRPVREAIDRRTEIDTRGLCDADIPLRALLAPQAVSPFRKKRKTSEPETHSFSPNRRVAAAAKMSNTRWIPLSSSGSPQQRAPKA
jgi:hypothetical protein